jgi:hypothetical protein
MTIAIKKESIEVLDTRPVPTEKHMRIVLDQAAVLNGNTASNWLSVTGSTASVTTSFGRLSLASGGFQRYGLTATRPGRYYAVAVELSSVPTSSGLEFGVLGSVPTSNTFDDNVVLAKKGNTVSTSDGWFTFKSEKYSAESLAWKYVGSGSVTLDNIVVVDVTLPINFQVENIFTQPITTSGDTYSKLNYKIHSDGIVQYIEFEDGFPNLLNVFSNSGENLIHVEGFLK